MVSSIDLNNQFLVGAHEVGYIVANDMLSAELYAKSLPTYALPQEFFSYGLPFPVFSGICLR